MWFRSLAVLLCLLAVRLPYAAATCDAIPGTAGRFRGAFGLIDRPFARPGDAIEVGLDAACDRGRRFAGETPYMVSLVFRGPDVTNVVMIAPSCAAVLAGRAGCEAALDGGTVSCRSAAEAGLGLVERDGRTRLRFQFPDTDDVLVPPGDGRGFAGTVAIAVTPADAPLVCAAALRPCRARTDALVCIDELFAEDGACGDRLDPVFGQFTALPPANDFGGLCTDPSPPCTGDAPEVQAAIDAAGNLLVPMDWRRVLVRRSDVPVPRLLRGTIRLEAFAGSGNPLLLPDATALSAFSLQGGLLPPIFAPQLDPAASDRLTLFGSSDAPAGVLRIARRPTCRGGPHEGVLCQRDADCTPGRCGGGLFDFGARAFAHGGPLVMRRNACLGGATPLAACATTAECSGGDCVTFSGEAADPVPLDGLNVADRGFAFVVNEGLVGEDRNGDADRRDDVLQLVDGRTGRVLPVGEGSPGRAVARLFEPPFSRPALATVGDTIAFLEPEPAAGHRDANRDGDRTDTILRAYRLSGDVAVDLTGGQSLVAEAAPAVNEQSVAIAGGRLWFRSSEAAAARRTTAIVSYDTRDQPVSDACELATAQALSADGRFATFLSVAPDVTPDDRRCFLSGLCRDAFLIDRDADGNGRFDEPGGTTVVRVSGGQDDASASVSAVSGDGSVVAFVSRSATLVAGDTNGLPDAFVYDRATGLVDRVSVGTGGGEGRQGVMDTAGAIAVSADGSIVVFASASSRLVTNDFNDAPDVFVHDRRAGTTERINLGDDGAEANGPSFVRGLSTVAISGDGRWVAFDSEATNLVPGDGNGVADVFVRDRVAGRTRRVSIGVRGEESNSASRAPVFAGDGRTLAFASAATNLVPGVTNGVTQLFAHDLAARVTSVVSVASDGTAGDSSSGEPSLSADGRFVAFTSFAASLVPDDRNGIRDVFLHDRLTGITERLSLTAPGNEVPRVTPTSESAAPVLSADGTSTIFVCTDDLVPGVMRHRAVFTRAADPGDTAADLTGDGLHAATVLRALDLGATPGTPPRTLCPAALVVAQGGVVAFLRPEAAGDAPGCPAGPDLNADGDEHDFVVQRAVGDGDVESLGLAARALALSDVRLAALVSERDQGRVDLNHDGDLDDLVVFVHAAAGAGPWRSLGLAADALVARGGFAFFPVPEAAQGTDLNGDGDRQDRVLHVLRPDDTIENLGLAVEDLVASDTLLAFRVREAAQGMTDLNDDGDSADDVLFVYDLALRALRPTGQAVTPCRLEACDPRLPYRPLINTVRFLTFEAEQGVDLNADGDTDDLVLQTFNLRAAGEALSRARATRDGMTRTLAAVAAGVCGNDGTACATDAGCPIGDRCIVPPGACVLDRGTPCEVGQLADCAAGEFCGSDVGAVGRTTCRRAAGPCGADTDCVGGARCRGADQRLQRLAMPLGAAGRDVVAGIGRCVGMLDGIEGTACAIDADCPATARCRADLVSAALADHDGDELPDPFDTCPDVADPQQSDLDGDGVGDACDRRTAGNGRREAGEECDGDDDVVCPGQCQPDATCFCATEIAAGGLRARRRAGALAGRTTVQFPGYDGQAVLLRLNDATGRVVASGAAEDFERIAENAWRARRRSPGLVKVAITRRNDTIRVTLRTRGWFAAGVVSPLRLTVTVGDRCYAAVTHARTVTTSTVTTTTVATTTSTASSTSTTAISTTTTTLAPGCCGAHRMILETVAGGTFRLGAVPAISLPAGTRIVLDVSAPDAQCRHTVSIPPDGFAMPPFCVGLFPWTTTLTARGCAAGDALGAGTMWDGGSGVADPDVAVVGDTSDGLCNPPGEACLQSEGEAADNPLGAQLTTFGDGVLNPAGLHLALSLPVLQHAWDAEEAPGQDTLCPDLDGVSTIGEGIATTYSMLRLTTGAATARFADANADGCAFSGLDSGAAKLATGVAAAGPCCVVGQPLTLAAAGIEYTGGFIGDVTATATLPARVVACEAPAQPASCDALVGGGRVVTSLGFDSDSIRAVIPLDQGRLLGVGLAGLGGGRPVGIGLARYDADGRLDPGFGSTGSGRVRVDVGREFFVTAAVAGAAGGIVVAGFDPSTQGNDDDTADVAVARLHADGTLDPTFGLGGATFGHTDGPDRFEAVATDAQGRVLAAGAARGTTDDFLLMRFDANGQPDLAFGDNGRVVTDFPSGGAPGNHDRAVGIVVEPSGKVVLAGTVGQPHLDDGRLPNDGDFGLARYDADGHLDPTFGDGGRVRTVVGPDLDRARAFLRTDDGGYVLVGGSRFADFKTEAVIVRYRSDGSLDGNFGVGGIVRTRPASTGNSALAATVTADGRLVVGAVVSEPFQLTPAGERIEPFSRWVFARFDLATGALDGSFGQYGATSTTFGGYRDELSAMLPLPDGGFLAAGAYDQNSGFGREADFAVARYLNDGRIDPSFGGQCGWEVEPRLNILP